jgi:hypothetical protein
MRKSQNASLGGDGNVTTIDLGETIDRAVRTEAARLAGPSKSKDKEVPSRFSRYTGGYRPGMFGGSGSRPSWYGSSYRPGMSGPWKLGDMLKLPKQLEAKDALTGVVLGTVGNRVLSWVVPGIVKTESKIATEAIAFGVGLVPYLAKPNAMTVGIAIPGLVYLAGALTEYAIEKTQLLGAKPVLAGRIAGSPDAATAARRKLQEVQARINAGRHHGGSPRVVARPAQRVA